jgi:hypothetical protein
MRLPVRDKSIWFTLNVDGVERGVTNKEFDGLTKSISRGYGELARGYMRDHGRVKKFGLWW